MPPLRRAADTRERRLEGSLATALKNLHCHGGRVRLPLIATAVRRRRQSDACQGEIAEETGDRPKILSVAPVRFPERKIEQVDARCSPNDRRKQVGQGKEKQYAGGDPDQVLLSSAIF